MSSRRLEQLLARVLEVDSAALSDASGPPSLATWDSLRHLEVVAALREVFGATLSAREIVELKSVGDARRMLAKRGIEP
jgi:acyl carrier protein